MGLTPFPGGAQGLGQLCSLGLSVTQVLHFSLSCEFQMIFQVTFCDYPGKSKDILRGDICASRFSYHTFERGDPKKLAFFPGIKLKEAKS